MTMPHIPRNSEIVRSTLSKTAKDIKPFIERALDDDAVIGKAEPYLLNGGVEGHKILDLNAVADVVIKYDATHGNNISNKHLSGMEVINQLRVVLRRRYVLDKRAKIVGLNAKYASMLTAPTE